MIKYEITECRWVDFHFFSKFSFLWLRIVLLASYLLLSQQSEGIVCMFGSHRFFANRLLSTDNEGGPLSPRSQYQPDMA